MCGRPTARLRHQCSVTRAWIPRRAQSLTAGVNLNANPSRRALSRQVLAIAPGHGLLQGGRPASKGRKVYFITPYDGKGCGRIPGSPGFRLAQKRCDSMPATTTDAGAPIICDHVKGTNRIPKEPSCRTVCICISGQRQDPKNMFNELSPDHTLQTGVGRCDTYQLTALPRSLDKITVRSGSASARQNDHRGWR